jgi:hypothetical protein
LKVLFTVCCVIGVGQPDNCGPIVSGLKEVLQLLTIKNNPLKKVKIIVELTNYLTQNKTQKQKIMKKASNLQLQ